MKLRKSCALLLAVLLLAGLCPAAVLADEDGMRAEAADLSGIPDLGSYTDGDGTVYTVLKTPESMLTAVQANMKGNYILGADMDMGGTEYRFPMFGGSAFEGILDGNGHSITHFSVASSVNANNGLLFHSLSGTPVIRNLTVGSAGAHITAVFSGGNAESIGGIAGAMKNADSRTLLSGITVYSDMTYTGVRDNTVMIGGMIGKAGPCTISECSFYGSILFAASSAIEGKNTMAGGMVGRHQVSEGTLIIRSCHNYADIDISARTRNPYVRECAGGMLGSAEYPVEITGCTNAGAMVSDHQSGGMAGGIKGGKSTSHTFLIRDCTNTGEITASVGAGGILGEVGSGGSASDSTFSVEVSRCDNLGKVTVLTSDEGLLSEGNCGAGGIIGRAKFGYLTVRNCYSIGDISSPGKTGAHSPTASGIVGFLYVNDDAQRLSAIRNCFAVGILTFGSTQYQGCGICTASSNSASKGYLPEITDCYYLFEPEQGNMSGACNMQLSASSAHYGEKTAEEFSSGAVAELLGEAFTQIPGTDTYPVLKPVDQGNPDTGDDGQRKNLFSGSLTAGYYDEKGRFRVDTGYQTRDMLAVSPGMVLTVAALRADQPSVGHAFDAGKNSVGSLHPDTLTLTAELGGGYGIYTYVVPESVAFISVTVPARRAYLTLFTGNDPFDAEEYYDYFGIRSMSGSTESPLWQKRALFAGDSISYGYSDTSVNGMIRAYAGRVAYDYDMDYVNVSVSGATLTNLSQNRVLTQLTPYLGECFDYVLLQGGVNDANTNFCNAPVGAISEGKTPGSFDTSTYAGALEELLCTVRNAFPDAAVGFVITYQMPRVLTISSHYGDYIQVTKGICEKWKVDILNLYEDAEINQTVLATASDSFLKDGVHPNGSGYDRLSPYIAAFMETLQARQSPVTPLEPIESGEETGQGVPGTSGSPEDGTRGTGTSTDPISEPSAGCASSVRAVLFPALLCAAAMILLALKRKPKHTALRSNSIRRNSI